MCRNEDGVSERTNSSSTVVLLGRTAYAERIYVNIGLNELCEATVPAKLRLIGRSTRESAPSLQMARAGRDSALAAAA